MEHTLQEPAATAASPATVAAPLAQMEDVTPDAAPGLFGIILGVCCLYLRGWREQGAARLKGFPV